MTFKKHDDDARIRLAGPALTVFEVIAPDQYTELGDGDCTVTIKPWWNLHRDDGSPAQVDDVLSVQEDGSLQSRPKGTSGVFERCRKTAQGAVYSPRGADGRTVLIGGAADAPNR